MTAPWCLRRPGYWLIHDPKDFPPAQWALWHQHAGIRVDAVVAWTGAPYPEPIEIDNDEPSSTKFRMRLVPAARVDALLMAAHHGLFQRHAARLWEELVP